MRTYDISRPPELINIGFDGENKWRPRGFNCTDWLQKHPDGIITLWIQPEGVKKAFPVSTTKTENIIVWYPLSEELYPGSGKLQLTIQDGEFIGKSDTINFEVNKSLVSGGVHPDSQPSWATKMVDDVTAQADRAAEAAERAEQASGEEVISEAVENYFEEHPVVVEETDPTVPAWAKAATKPTYTATEVGALPDSYTPPVTSVNGKTGAVALTASDIHALPDSTVIPEAVTEQDVAGWGFTKNTGTYSKPSGGIPASDLAAGVIPAVPQMATDPDMADWTSGKTVDAAVLAADFGVAGRLIMAKYTKPRGGIPASDLAADVQTSLGKADTALQQHQSLSGYATEAWVQNQGYLTQHQDISGKADKIPRIAKASTDTTATVEPNKLYVFPEMASLTITLAAITDNTIVNEYHFIFTSGATATTTTFPAIPGLDDFAAEADTVYEVSILEGRALVTSWEVSA